jgi:hypothetical protein
VELTLRVVRFLTSGGRWIGVIPGAVVFAFAMWTAVRRRAQAAAARVAEALAPVPLARDAWREDEPVVLRGTIDAPASPRLASVAALGFADGKEQQELGARGWPEAFLVCGDDRIAIDGPVAIHVGTRVIRHHGLPPDHFELASIARDATRRASQMKMWLGGVDAFHVRLLAPGDEVLARGRLRKVDDGWVLLPRSESKGSTIDVAAIAKPVIDPPPVPPLTTMARAFLFAIVTWSAIALAMTRL